MRSTDEILEEIADTQARLSRLKEELATVSLSASKQGASTRISKAEQPVQHTKHEWSLPPDYYRRYGRQMILPEIGLQGQSRLRDSSVLVVGLGGLGCPAAKYLAGAGVGRIGLLDGDTVEVSNLHRQILHATGRVGMHKVFSAADSLKETNDIIEIEPHPFHLTPSNALDLFSRYDLVLDCTDHPTSRYLISDAAVITGKPLVSASALKTDGQLIVLNNPPRLPGAISDACQTEEANSPAICYRCIFPKPPPADSIVSCGEGGILGPVVGVMGVLQALEAIRILVHQKELEVAENTKMLIFSAYGNPQFRSLRMRSHRKDCDACGDAPKITRESLTSGQVDYVAFCGVAQPVNILQDCDRLAPEELQRQMHNTAQPAPIIVDVREKTHFELASIPGSINIPYSLFESGQIKGKAMALETCNNNDSMTSWLPDSSSPVVFVCSLGNDSQLAARQVKELGIVEKERWIGDLKGGLRSWRAEVQPDFPEF